MRDDTAYLRQVQITEIAEAHNWWSASFAGQSGTRKTMATDVIAGALRHDLYRVEQLQMVNKRLGETEENLTRVFHAAVGRGAILLSGEANDLFGRHRYVQDSHYRYANIEINYLR